ncbi:MAG: guanine deaminase [Alphaproteobacteria bacterium]|nr:guanine deaminase [Alphaproteobacteria bacterium]MDE2629513.1 guanine deaminase [Alphaproteobacteria bacterium]
MARQAYRASIFHLLGDPGSGQHIEDGVLVVEDGHVAELGAWDEIAPRLSGVTVEHFAGSLIVPGFVDSHVHYPQVDIVASRGAHLLEWLSAHTFPTEARFHHKDVAAETARFFLDQLLRNGTTTALVFATVHKVSAEALFEEALARNMRIVAGKVLMDKNAPAGISDTAETGYMESRALIRAWHGKGRLSYAVTPRFALTSSERQLELAGRLLVEHPGVRLHTHLSENVEELTAVHRAFPDCTDYFAVYEKFGLATPTSVFAHCLHLSPGEWARLGKSGSGVAFCPTSNLFLGSGLFDLAAAEGVGARVGLGTDVGAGTSLSLFAAMNDAYKVCQMRQRSLDPFKLFYLATLGGARTLGLDDKVGNFETGKEADFIVLDAKSLPLLRRRLAHVRSPAEKLFAIAILGDDRAVARTYVAGALAYARE